MFQKYTLAARSLLLIASMTAGANSALADVAAVAGREGQAFGQSLADKFQFPTEGSGGSVNLGNGESIKPGDMAPKGDGFYVSEPNVGGLQGIYDSDETMHDVGRGTQNQLWQDAQLKGNPFDPDPAMRDQPGPSTVSGAVYQIITGVSDARAQVPDLTNDPIVNTAGDHILNEGLLESFGDCSVETEVTETSRPVHVPDMEYCDRVTAPAPTNCEVKHEIVLERVLETVRMPKQVYTNTDPNTSRVTSNCVTSYDVSGNFVASTSLCDGLPDQTLKNVSYISVSGARSFNVSKDGVLKCQISSYKDSPSAGNLRFTRLGTARCSGGKLVVPVVQRSPFSITDLEISATVMKETVKVVGETWWPEECIRATQ